PCLKDHNLELKISYENALLKNEFSGFDEECLDSLQAFIAECDENIRMHQNLLDMASEDNDFLTLKREIHEKCDEIEILLIRFKQEKDLMKTIEMLRIIEQLKQEKIAKEDLLSRTGYHQQKLRLCEVCSSYLAVLDDDRQLGNFTHFKF
ncbi:putative RNA-binding protein Luc7-like 1, partial [Nowakowskiella sp. JEL0078]